MGYLEILVKRVSYILRRVYFNCNVRLPFPNNTVDILERKELKC